MNTKYKIDHFYKKNLAFMAGMLFVLFLTLSFLSCTKYLDEKSDQSWILPKTLNDCEDLLNNVDAMNEFFDLVMLITASDNFELSWSRLNSRPAKDRALFIWDANAPTSWNWTPVLYANTVLDVLERIIPEGVVEQARWNQLKGEALFVRSLFFFDLLQVYSLPYDETTANTDLGIPIRLTADVNEVTLRSSVQDSYDNVITSLTEAIELLPDLPSIQTRASKAAAYGLLSRIYLAMRNYPMALTNATNCLNLHDDLYDYNDGPMPQAEDNNFTFLDNPEVIFQSYGEANLGFWYGPGNVSTDLYASYATNDLRPDLFFRDAGDGPQMYGSYGFRYYYFFTGIAVDEILITRAECYARNNQVTLAIADLNALLEKRYETGTFTPYDPVGYTSVTATQLILQERRKELIFRGLRWLDIRRLNKENNPDYAVGTLTRTFPDNPTIYTLPANDLRYAFLIPQKSVDLSGMEQNPR